MVALLLVLFATGSWSASRAEDTSAAPDEASFGDVLPAADSFGQIQDDPPAAPGLADGDLVGYVFSTRSVVESVGYSGKPLDVLVGIDLEGRITGARMASSTSRS